MGESPSKQAVPSAAGRDKPEGAAPPGENDRKMRFYEALLSAITDFVYVLDRESRFLYANEPLLKIWGLRMEDAIGKNFHDLRYPEELAVKLHRQVRTVVETKCGLADKAPYVSPTGVPGFYEYILSPLFAADGSVEAIAGCTRDVTADIRGGAAQRLLAAVVESSDDAIITKDLDGIITSWNHAAEKLFGYSAAEMIGRPLSIIAPPERPDEMGSILDRIRRGEKVNHFETQRMAKDRRRLDVSVTVSPLHDGEGKIIGASKIVRDISERKRSEQTLREISDQLRLIADTAPVLIAHCDREHRYKFVNEPYAARFGLQREEVIGRRIADVIGEESYGRIRPYLDRSFAGENVEFEISIPYRDGDTHFMHCAYAPEQDASGGVTGVVAAIVDITDRKRTEEALRESEERTRVAAETTGTGIWAWNIRTNQIRWDAQIFAIYGVAPKPDGLVEYTDWSGAVLPEDLPGTEASLMETIRAGGRGARRFRIVRQSDGKCRHIEAVETTRADAQGATEWVIGTNLDITERIEAEESLRAAKEAAEAANRSKDRFLAILSHELRTPLTPVLMAAGALEHDPDLRPDVREDVVMIRRNVELEVKLIDDLLDLSRITSGKVALKTEPVDLAALVRHVCEICQPQITQHCVRLETEISGEMDMISADPARLQQILWNVLRNAVKFTPEQGTIRVTAARISPTRCEVRVSDTGIGIPPEKLPHIFEAFEQGDARITQEFGGLGLGLSISRALVELHGGTIRAESEGRGRGSTFIVELPSRRSAPAAAAPATEVKPAAEGGKIRLLLVEDHADTARTLGRLLRSAGFATFTASDVAHALAIAEREPFDVLVSDLGLPDGDGYEVMRKVRAIRDVPGIAMSGYGMDEDVRRGREAGFSEHLVKPIEIAQLIAAIRRVAERPA